jgi:hypothetical protein
VRHTPAVVLADVFDHLIATLDEAEPTPQLAQAANQARIR